MKKEAINNLLCALEEEEKKEHKSSVYTHNSDSGNSERNNYVKFKF